MHADFTRRSVIQLTGTAFALPVVQVQLAHLENGMPFTPKFVDLARNFTTVQGTGPVPLGQAVSGYTSLAAALSAGDQFYYCIQGVDKPQEREVGRGTMQADGKVGREPVAGELTHFTGGTKTIALVTAAEWFTQASGGASIEAASRSALAATPSGRGPAMLTERGREGLFAWDPSNLSAKVALDTRQGLHVAAAADPTGASGAWVRRFDGPVNPKWFGLAEGDAGGANGAANSAAISAMLATLRARAVNDSFDSFYQGAETIRFPTGYFEFASTIDITDGTLILEGASAGFPQGRGTVLKFPAGVTGIRVQKQDTSGATASGESHRAGAGSIIRNLSLVGGFTEAGGEAEAHGIHLRGRAHIENVFIDNFEGDGIHGNTSGNTDNVNNSRIIGGRIASCRSGIALGGADANTCVIIGMDVTQNREWGVKDTSFLGNSYFGCHASTNGRHSTNTPGSRVHFGGQRYFVIAGQQVWCSTNAPSGTTADNQGWAWLSTGGVDADAYPDWASGAAYRAGGSYYSEDDSAAGVFDSCYHEGGQGEAQIAPPSIVIGGKLADYVHGAASVLRGATSGYLETARLRVMDTFRAEAASNFFGATTGPNLNVQFDTGGSTDTLTFRSTSGTTQTDGMILTTRNSGLTLRGYGAAGAQGNVKLASGTTVVAESKATGFNVRTGFTYQLNDVPVVGARKAGWAVDTGTAKRTANATYSGTAEAAYTQATVQALMDAVRDLSQTMKALKDDLHASAGHGLIGP